MKRSRKMLCKECKELIDTGEAVIMETIPGTLGKVLHFHTECYSRHRERQESGSVNVDLDKLAFAARSVH